MRERDEAERDRAEDPAQAPPAPAAPAIQHVMAMQRSAGNRAVAAALARHAEDRAPEQVPPGAGAAPALTQAAQEAEAVRTWGMLRTVHQLMLASPDTRTRNTGLMLDPPGEAGQGHRVHVQPMTLRSDSPQLVADRGDNATQTAYYFYGSTQDNEHRHGPTTLGTIMGGNTVLVRGRRAGGDWQTNENVMGALVHETSHILVKDYGEHPGTATDSASFDRYRDEFRAYFVEPHGNFEGRVGADRVAAIRTHLVGTSATAGGYPDLRAAYWALPAATNTFKQQVDAHTAPDGFNLDNSPLLDRLVALLRDERAGRATVEATLFQVTVLSPAERQEAAGASLIASLLAALPPADAQRIRQALTSPAAVGFGRELNPNQAPEITAFLEAVGTKAPDRIVETYRACPAAARGDIAMNAHVLTWLGRTLANEQLLRTCVTCMVTGRSFAYFERVATFARACSAAAGAAAMPDALRSALRGLSLDVRLAYYRFCEDDYRDRVLPLEEPVRREVTAILRGDADA
jgi:hypothetical protein